VPIPTVDPADLKQFWNGLQAITRVTPPGPTRAIGAGALGFDVKARGPEFEQTFLALTTRNWLISGLFARGLLKDYADGDQLRDEVFRAAARMPCTEQEAQEAMVWPVILEEFPDRAEQEEIKRKSLALDGYDPEKPKVAEKFFAWMRSCT